MVRSDIAADRATDDGGAPRVVDGNPAARSIHRPIAAHGGAVHRQGSRPHANPAATDRSFVVDNGSIVNFEIAGGPNTSTSVPRPSVLNRQFGKFKRRARVYIKHAMEVVAVDLGLGRRYPNN